MSIVTEVCLYLFVVLGIICTTMTVCNEKNNLKLRYVRKKKETASVLLEIKFSGISDCDLQQISYAIANGQFTNIYDLVDEFKVFKKDE